MYDVTLPTTLLSLVNCYENEVQRMTSYVEDGERGPSLPVLEDNGIEYRWKIEEGLASGMKVGMERLGSVVRNIYKRNNDKDNSLYNCKITIYTFSIHSTFRYSDIFLPPSSMVQKEHLILLV